MRVAIAVTSNANEIYPGPFGHAPFFAIYEKEGDDWQRLELRDNPYKALEGGGKGRLLARLLADCDLWLAARFGHEHHQHEGHDCDHEHRGGGRGLPAERTRQVNPAASIEEILAAL